MDTSSSHTKQQGCVFTCDVCRKAFTAESLAQKSRNVDFSGGSRGAYVVISVVVDSAYMWSVIRILSLDLLLFLAPTL